MLRGQGGRITHVKQLLGDSCCCETVDELQRQSRRIGTGITHEFRMAIMRWMDGWMDWMVFSRTATPRKKAIY